MLYLAHIRRRIAPALFFILSTFTTAATAASTPALWVATKDAAKVYLFGSMHFGRPDFYPLPEAVEQAFTQSTRLVVEVNLLQIGANAQQTIFHHAGLPAGTNLKEVISPETYTALEQWASNSQIPASSFQRFQPWYITLMLVEAEIRKTDLQQQLGLDLYFLRRAVAFEKAIEDLETFDSQLGLFSSISLKDQESFLRQTLTDLQHSSNYLKSAADAWIIGDTDMLDKNLVEPFRDQKETELLFDKMFTQRNIKMARAATRYLEEGEDTFLVVGIGHMLGDMGIIQLLRSQGISVRRLPTNPSETATSDGASHFTTNTGLP